MTPQLIEEIVALIVQLGPLAVDLFVKLEGLLNLGPDEKKNIANAIAAAQTADQDTINRVADWMKANGFQQSVTFAAVPVPATESPTPPK
jgi:L-cysteine desulfidase